MSPFVQIPQTTRAKSRLLDDDDSDVIDGLPSRTPEPREPADEQKTSSLLDPDAFRRLSTSPSPDRHRHGSLSARARSPVSVPAKGGDDDKFNPQYLDPDAFRRYSSSPFQDGRQSPMPYGAYSLGPQGQTWKASLDRAFRRFWAKNRGVVFVAIAQFFGATMNLAARLLELDGQRMNPFQILFLRMIVTILFSFLYMYWKHVPHAPFGAPEVRWLLAARGFTGFFGLFGMWVSMMYLPLADATVLTFLVPCVSGYICHVLLHDPFTRKEQIASFIALAGVVLIARPASLFSLGSHTTPTAPASPIDMPGNVTQSNPDVEGNITSSQRLFAVGIALLGVLGGSGAFTTIRWIGKRAHPLISVSYFSVWVFIVSTTVLSLAPVLDIGQPGLRFGLPHGTKQWLLMLTVAICGFSTQYFLTAGLGGERSNRASAMVYTNMLFAAAFDKWIFGHEMGPMSLAGCGLIVGSALWVAVSRKEQRPEDAADVEAVAQVTEAVPMLGGFEVGEEEEEEEEGIALEHMR